MKKLIKTLICSLIIMSLMCINAFAAMNFTKYTSSQGKWNNENQFIVNNEPVKGWIFIDNIPYYFENDGKLAMKNGKSFKIYQDDDVRALLCNNKLLVRSREFAQYIDNRIALEIELRKQRKYNKER